MSFDDFEHTALSVNYRKSGYSRMHEFHFIGKGTFHCISLHTVHFLALSIEMNFIIYQTHSNLTFYSIEEGT